MKILGKGEDKTYVALISHKEIEKIVEKYYGKLPDLKVNDDFPISCGHDFRDDIKTACNKMVDAMKAFEDAKNTLHTFALMVSEAQINDGK